MSLSPSDFIRHMLDDIDYIESRISNTDLESFQTDETLKRAFVRSIENIGEALKKHLTRRSSGLAGSAPANG